MTTSSDSKPLRSEAELQVGAEVAASFRESRATIEERLETFPIYVRRQHLTRFLALYELFKRVLRVKGSIVECGVHRGYGLMSWAKLSAILEPNNLMRRIYGFDTFSGFPAIASEDQPNPTVDQRPLAGDFGSGSLDELLKLISLFDRDRFLGHIPKIELVKGDATTTIPAFMESHRHLVVSLLFMDFDLFEPSRTALTHFLPRMPKGSILAFDELDNPLWPGETMALLESVGIRSVRLERLDFDPYISFAEIQ